MIDRELVYMNAYLPVELAKLSRLDPEKALEILRHWGDGTMHLREMWAMVQSELEKNKG